MNIERTNVHIADDTGRIAANIEMKDGGTLNIEIDRNTKEAKTPKSDKEVKNNSTQSESKFEQQQADEKGINKKDVTSKDKYTFPLDINSDSYLSSYRQFGSRRSHGKRTHAGVDIYAPAGSNVRSIGDGVVTRGRYYFYNGTYAVDVNYGKFTIRYGEIDPIKLKTGDKVTKGQIIGKIKVLEGINSTMLHLEMYSNKATGPLTTGDLPYKRRRDLIDPTKFIDSLRKIKFKL